ncbi:ankyrin repeat domain-containing protein [Methyloversatilis thermotolerans]|uniref:ankyrin repeat domain-containing protein n=1 Tax=Methyloversatilis thermotolerans TaxID=1346290 RepID=UPI00039F0CA5|nr:ankyrin repeat domain-containing protein [Methyloversatilis thermotolerans]
MRNRADGMRVVAGWLVAMLVAPALADDREAARHALEAARVKADSGALVQYAGIGDGYVVKQLLLAGVPADAPLPGRQLRPLHNAAAQGHLRIVDQLIGAGARVDAVDDNGCTALAAASWRGHLDVMRSLLDAGASVSAGSPACPALHQAVLGAQASAIKLLIARGADPAELDGDRRDAWTLARILHREALLPAAQ